MKNSFKALRAKLRATEKKLNSANRVIRLQLDEIITLSDDNASKDVKIDNLEKCFLTEEKLRKRLKLRLASVSQLKNNIYDNYMKDLEKKNKSIFRLQLLSAGLAFVCNILAVLYFIK